MSAAEAKQQRTLLHFNGFTLDLVRRGLYRGQQRVHLTSKPLETLIFLVENRGRVIEKKELLNAVWKDTFVTEDTLVHAIREIRRALEDDRENPEFVQTVPRQGYRFVCEISDDGLPRPDPIDNLSAPTASAGRRTQRIARWLWIASVGLGLIAIAVWAGWFRGDSSMRSKANQPHAGRISRQITAGEFASGKPAFSPDGKFILYVSSSEATRGYGDLFIRQSSEGSSVRITSGINPSGDLPVFTANGSHVVFSIPRVDQTEIRHHDLWRVPSLGGPPERFIEDASGAGFSPDEKWVAYTKRSAGRDALWLSPCSDTETHVEVCADAYTPRWAPSGTWLAYTTSDPNGGDGDIWICKVSQTNDGQPAVFDKKQITREHKQIYGLTWAADSGSIIFSSKRSGSAQLYQVLIADGSISPFLTGVGEYEAPSASPDGKTVIFHNKNLINDLMIGTSFGKCEAKSISYNQFHLWPRLSPSGEMLTSVLREADGTGHLYLSELEKNESSLLSHRSARHPSWVDAQSIAFLSPGDSAPNTDVVVVNISTREVRTLTSFAGEANWLAIHPDRKRLAVVIKSDAGERILLRDLSSQSDRTIHEGSEYEYLRWSPDGSALCWNRPGVSRNAPLTSGGIWVLQLDRPESCLVARDGYCPVWSEDGEALYFTVRGGQQGLWRIDLRQKKEQHVCDWGRVFSYDIVGRRMALAQHKNNSQIYSISMDQ